MKWMRDLKTNGRMIMKKILMSMLIFGMSTTVLLVDYTSGIAGGACSNRDLDGDYQFTVIEVYTSGGIINYCDQAGTVTFDSASGTATVSGTKRCNGVVGPIIPEPLTYAVSPDCNVEITSPYDTVHGQIVNNGRIVLLDGTTSPDPDKLFFHGVAAKQ